MTMTRTTTTGAEQVRPMTMLSASTTQQRQHLLRFAARSWRNFYPCLLSVLILLFCAATAQAEKNSAAATSHANVNNDNAAIAAVDSPPALLLAETYRRGAVTVSDYLVSEKLDGVRAYWDGKNLRTRRGRIIVAPDWFTAKLPAEALDGELWLGHQRFDDISGLVRRETLTAESEKLWRSVRYMVFELPQGEGDFFTRYQRLKRLCFHVGVPWLEAIAQYPIADEAELDARLRDVLAAGGEGLMLHKKDALYVSGRSNVLLKVKPWLDAEARVIGYVAGKGKYQGQTGSLRVEDAEGRQFSVGSGLSDALRKQPPPVGTLITYRYREKTERGMPRFPVFLRVRRE